MTNNTILAPKLSQDELKVYAAIGNTGTTALPASLKTGIPSDTTYKILKDFERRGIVRWMKTSKCYRRVKSLCEIEEQAVETATT